jgi:outer membrane protein assembly factor BamD
MRLSVYWPVSLVCVAVLFACSSKSVTDIPNAEQRFHLGMAEYNDGNYLEAIQHFEVIRLQFQASAIADSAKYYAGMSHFQREEFLLGQYEFTQLIQNFPKSPLLQDAYFMYAECLYRLSPRVDLDQTYTAKAIDALQTFVEVYGKHPKAQEAEAQMKELFEKLAEKEYDTGVLYVKMQNSTAALVYFNNVIDRYYNTSYADDALAQKIRILMKRKTYAEADDLIQNFLRKYPDSSYRDEVEQQQKNLQKATAIKGS